MIPRSHFHGVGEAQHPLVEAADTRLRRALVVRRAEFGAERGQVPFHRAQGEEFEVGVQVSGGAVEEVGGRAVAVDRLEFDAGEGGLEGGAGADQGFQELPFAAGAVHVVRGEEVGAGGEEAEGGGEGVGVGGGEEGEVAGVGPQRGVEGGGAVELAA